MTRVQKPIAITIIMLSLWVQVQTNLNLKIPKLSQRYVPGILNPLVYQINQTDRQIQKLGYFFGINNRWRMFSPVDRYQWQIEFVAIYLDGQETVLPLPHQSRRNGWEKNVINFREGKLELNLYSYPHNRQYYVDYLCQVYQQPNHLISAIRLDLYWRTIFSPTEARERGTDLGKVNREIGKLGRYQCPTLSGK